MKVIWRWLINLFNKLFKHKKEAEPKDIPLEELKWESPKWFKSIFRMVNTSHGGHNMPKFQPCPEGHGQKKRANKTIGGADYWCDICQCHFFVRAAVVRYNQ